MFECPDCGLFWSAVAIVPGTKRTKVRHPPKKSCGCGVGRKEGKDK